MSKRMKCALIFCFFVFGEFAFADTPETSLPLQITLVSDGFTEQGADIRISIKNTSLGPIQMYDIQFPWALRVNLLLVATTKKTWKNLRLAGFAVEDPVNVKKVQLAPGETLSGTVRLVEYIDHTELRKQKEDLLVFWHFVARSSDREFLGEYGGWTSVPYKKSLDKKP